MFKTPPKQATLLKDQGREQQFSKAAGLPQKGGKTFTSDPTKGAEPSSKKVHGRPSDLSGKHLHQGMRGKRSSEV